jgi:hypothetical protein
MTWWKLQNQNNASATAIGTIFDPPYVSLNTTVQVVAICPFVPVSLVVLIVSLPLPSFVQPKLICLPPPAMLVLLSLESLCLEWVVYNYRDHSRRQLRLNCLFRHLYTVQLSQMLFFKKPCHYSLCFSMCRIHCCVLVQLLLLMPENKYLTTVYVYFVSCRCKPECDERL